MPREIEQVNALRKEAIERIQGLKRENLPRIGRPHWASSSGYNAGSWSDRGFNIAIQTVKQAKPEKSDTGLTYLRRLIDLVKVQRDRFQGEERDVEGACARALEAALGVINEVANAATASAAEVKQELARDSGRWRISYWDTFDREMPPQLETEGEVLEQGFVELWSRYLRETIKSDGRQGFARFSLTWSGRAIEVRGDLSGAGRLRGWIFGEGESQQGEPIQPTDPSLLAEVAAVHLWLVGRDRGSDEILELAAGCDSQQTFKRRLEKLKQ